MTSLLSVMNCIPEEGHRSGTLHFGVRALCHVLQVRDNYLQTIDNLIEVDEEVIFQSQMETGASSK